MEKRWFHVYEPSGAFGFAINKTGTIVECGGAIEIQDLLKGNNIYKDTKVRNWFRNKEVVEIIATKTNTECQTTKSEQVNIL